MSRHLAIAGLSAYLMLAGCNSPTTSVKPDGNSAALTAPTPDEAPATEIAPPNALQMVKHRTDVHLLELDAAAKARSQASVRPTSPPPVKVPEIEWVEPKPVELTLGPKQSDDAPRETPTVAAVQTLPPAPTPAPVAAPASAPAAVDPLEGELSQRLSSNPQNLAAQIDYQLLQLLRGKPVPEMDRISALSSEDRELTAALLDALVNLRTTVRGEPDLMLARKTRPLVDLADRLRTQGTLRIPVITLCREVKAFGVYEPLVDARFPAGRESGVIVYCDVENFTSRLNDQRMWETKLSVNTVLYNDAGQRVSEEKRVTSSDLSRNLRRDYYVARKIRIPANLPPGRYHLKMTIVDEQSSRIAEEGTSLEIAAVMRP